MTNHPINLNHKTIIHTDTIENECLKVFREGKWTSRDVSELIDRSILSVGATVSNLYHRGKIVRTGKRIYHTQNPSWEYTIAE